MREKFYGYYKPTEDEFQNLWESAFFVIDTNVLLDMFRFSEETVNALLATIENLKDRLWLPHRVASEYHKNLNDIIAEQVKNYEDTSNILNSFKKQIQEKLQAKKHPFLEECFQKDIADFCEKIDTELNKKKNDIESLLINNPRKDKIADLFSNKIGDEFEVDDNFKNEGKKRYENKIPPGYMDSNKADEQFGDLIIWKEIIQKSKATKKHIIFVTRDVKEDWFLEKRGKKLGPRPELIQEFEKETGQKFYAYQTIQFLQYSNTYLQSNINEEIIKEVAQVAKEQRSNNITEAVKTEAVYNPQNTTMPTHNTGSTSSESLTEQTTNV